MSEVSMRTSRRPRNTRFRWIALIIVVFVLASCVANTQRGQALQSALANNVMWRTHQPIHYRYQLHYYSSSEALFRPPAVMQITIRNKTIEAVSDPTTGQPPAHLDLTLAVSIDDVFRLIESRIVRTTVQYNRQYGFPELVEITRGYYKWSFAIDHFELLP
jgi:hypothetical protein